MDYIDDSRINEQLTDMRQQFSSLYDPRFKLTKEQYDRILDGFVDSSYRSVGAGSYRNTLQLVLTQHDRFNSNITPPNHEFAGLTFITRPRLNLTTSSLRQSRILTMLDTDDINSVKFMIRALLDTKWSSGEVYPEIANLISRSPLVNNRSPFNIPLCNCLTGITGWPDINMDTETTEGGFHSEDHTTIKGSDRLNKTYDLTLNFKDVLGGVIMSIFHMWMEYCALQAKGQVVAYQDDIFEQKINYTVSIYRFVLDPSRSTIVKWAKATGCFPKSVPIGACFDVNQGETYVSSSAKFSVPFTANKIEYNDPAILQDFNVLAERYNPVLGQGDGTSTLSPVNDTDNYENTPGDPLIASKYNFTGYPYIETGTRGQIYLRFKYIPEEFVDPFTSAMLSVKSELEEKQKLQHQNDLDTGGVLL